MRTVGVAAMAIRLWCWAGVLRVLKHVVPLGRLVQLVHARASGRGRSPAFESRLERYLASTHRFPWRAPGNCLERSLAAYRLLCAADAAPTLVVGLQHHPGAVRGHVWVVVDGRALAESPERLATYTNLLWFGADARRHPEGAAAASVAGIRFA